MTQVNDLPEVSKSLMRSGDGVIEGYDVNNPLGHPELASDAVPYELVESAAAIALTNFQYMGELFGSGKTKEAIDQQERATGMATMLDRMAPLKDNDFWANYLHNRVDLIKKAKAEAN